MTLDTMYMFVMHVYARVYVRKAVHICIVVIYDEFLTNNHW